jgi:hypothetical protein
MDRSAVGSVLLRGALVLVGTASLSAERQAPSGARDPQPPRVTAPRLFGSPEKNPYASIFPAPPVASTQDRVTVAPAGPEQKARVVCGMLVYPVTAALDPGIVVAPPSDPNVTTYTIRRITPLVCTGK